MIKRRLWIWLFLCDWITTALAWGIYFVYRKSIEIPEYNLDGLFDDMNLKIGLSVIPICWLSWFFFLGHYQQPYNRTRTYWVSRTFVAVLIGSLVLLFTLLRDDLTLNYVTYLQTFLVLLAIHVFLLILVRSLIFSLWRLVSKRQRHALSGLLVLGPSPIPVHDRLPIGVRLDDTIKLNEEGVLPTDFSVYDRIFVHTEDPTTLKKVVNQTGAFSDLIPLSISDFTYQRASRECNVEPLPGENWLTLQTRGWKPYEQHLKRIMDIAVSMLALLLLSPLMAWCAWRVKLSSEGPIIFYQKRVGRRGRPFRISKFRSMYIDAEVDGPALSSENDQRCTPWGRIMRKWRLDEIPQFYNVLIGDMSIVGPRPERPHYVLKLKKEVPGYDKILCVRPGITSWGQIKYGYASDVSEMVQRLRYDMLYVENLSLLLDLRILYYTLLVLWQGEGK